LVLIVPVHAKEGAIALNSVWLLMETIALLVTTAHTEGTKNILL